MKTLASKKQPNVVVIPTKASEAVQIYIGDYKTSKGPYDPIDINLSKRTSDLLRKYVVENRLQYGQPLFGKTGLSTTVSSMNSKMGYRIAMGVNFLRYMSAPSKGENLTSDELAHLAHEIRHSVEAQYKYMRHRLPRGHWRTMVQDSPAAAPAKTRGRPPGAKNKTDAVVAPKASKKAAPKGKVVSKGKKKTKT